MATQSSSPTGVGSALERVQDRLPVVEHVPGHGVDGGADAARSRGAGRVEELALDLQGGQLAAVGRGDAVGRRRVVRDRVQLGDRAVPATSPRLETPSSIIASTSAVVPSLR